MIRAGPGLCPHEVRKTGACAFGAAEWNDVFVGAAYYVWNHLLGKPREFQMEHGYWGPSFDDAAIQRALADRQQDLEAQRCTVRVIAEQDELCCWTARRVSVTW